MFVMGAPRGVGVDGGDGGPWPLFLPEAMTSQGAISEPGRGIGLR